MAQPPWLREGNRLRRVRERVLGVSVAELARHMKIAASSMYAFENGYRRINPEYALELKRITGVTLDFIYDDDHSTLSPRLRSLLAEPLGFR